jgi:hypothetical protein
MKLLAVTALVLATTACTAQQAPVNIATDIYVSCLTGFTQAYGLPQTKVGIERQLFELDKTCTDWTHAWLQGFLHQDRPNLTIAENLRFLRNKRDINTTYIEELTLSLPKR